MCTTFRMRQWIWLGVDPAALDAEPFLTVSSLQKEVKVSGGLTLWQKAGSVLAQISLSTSLHPCSASSGSWGEKKLALTAPYRRSVPQPGRTGAGSAVRTEPLKYGSDILQSMWKSTGVLCITTDIHINPEHFVQIHTVGSLHSYK